MKKLLYVGLCLSVVVGSLAGCATVTRGSTDLLIIESDPAGASVTTTLGQSGKTPCAFNMSRKASFLVKVQLDGYEAMEVQVQPKRSTAGSVGMAGNALVGGFIGAAVDYGTGAMYDLYPNPIKVTLVPVKKTSSLDSRSIGASASVVTIRWAK